MTGDDVLIAAGKKTAPVVAAPAAPAAAAAAPAKADKVIIQSYWNTLI